MKGSSYGHYTARSTDCRFENLVATIREYRQLSRLFKTRDSNGVHEAGTKEPQHEEMPANMRDGASAPLFFFLFFIFYIYDHSSGGHRAINATTIYWGGSNMTQSNNLYGPV
ncbi:MAG: hypothetical protein Unbinned5406contig1000_25 [Prokaryotic dsDNA virus sp.]|jgi:cobalamin biosynthesis protein CobD/CbiB|nr:MAG: hypothetical protein Unbinned5406contig1000_25 [Prokaryotic dsDNA virus sp.]